MKWNGKSKRLTRGKKKKIVILKCLLSEDFWTLMFENYYITTANGKHTNSWQKARSSDFGRNFLGREREKWRGLFLFYLLYSSHEPLYYMYTYKNKHKRILSL